MEKLHIHFNSDSNLTLSDTSKIEVAGGQLQLKGLGGGTYSTDAPTALTKNPISADRIVGIKEYASKPSNTGIKYSIVSDSQDLYYDGSNWVESNGTYAQSNTIKDVVANIDRLIIENFQVRVFLYTSSNTVRPTLDRLDIFYDKEPERSNSYNEHMTINGIIEQAFGIVGMKQLSPDDYQTGKDLLNGLISALKSDGIQTRIGRQEVVPLRASSVAKGEDGYDYECIKDHVSSTDTMPATGLKHLFFWKKLSTKAGANHQLNTRYVTSSQYDLPSEVFSVESAFLKKSDGARLEIEVMASWDAFNKLYSESTGNPSKLYFSKSSSPYIALYPKPQSLNDVIELSVQTYLDDADIGNQSLGLPREFNLAIVFGLAQLLIPQRGFDNTKYLQIKDMADKYLKMAKKATNEPSDIEFTMISGGVEGSGY